MSAVNALLAAIDRQPGVMVVALVLAVLLIIAAGALGADALVQWEERDETLR